MTFDAFARRFADILSFPHELIAYQRWLDAQPPRQPGERDYLFAEPRPRFEPRKEDVVVAMPGLTVKRQGARVLLEASDPEVRLEAEGLSQRDVERALGAVDGERCLVEVRWESGLEPEPFALFLRQTFGRVLFAPQAVEALESQLSGVEITRFAAAPYAVERPYWENMIAVRRRFESQTDAVESVEGMLKLMRELHVLALMGKSLDSFYKPASPAADHAIAPGALYLARPRLLATARGTLFLDGPRVKVPLLGGARYHELLCRSLGDPDAVLSGREHKDGKLPWGRVVTARADKDDAPAPWFCPPRPLQWAHFEGVHRALASALRAADEDDKPAVVTALAGFHQQWVRLHPFSCANQSIAMNVVGSVLRRSHGAGIPHGILDHFALRLVPEAYARLFRRAVAAQVVVDERPARRLARLRHDAELAFRLIERLAGCASLEAAEVMVAENPDAARAALLTEA